MLAATWLRRELFRPSGVILHAMRLQSFAAALAVSVLALPATAAITGTLMTSEGQPVAGARVSIVAPESQEARLTRLLSATPDLVPIATAQTDAKGAFSLASPKEPVVSLRVEARGYEPDSRNVEKDEDAGAIVLAKRELVKGTVTAAGKPVPNATVVLVYGAGDMIVKTDEQGRYEALDPKRLRSIHVVHPSYALDDKLFITAGTAKAADLNRSLVPGVAISGKAVAADGKTPVAKATIFVNNWPLATSGDDGSFAIAHATPRWEALTARKESLAGQRAHSNDKSLTVRMEKSAMITGRVTDAKTKMPVPGATVTLGERRMMPGSSGPQMSAIADAKGAYSIAAPAGQFMLLASHPAYDGQTADVSLTTGQSLSRDLAMQQLARATGVVVDEQKRPVVAASVSAENVDTGGMRFGGPMRMFRDSQRNTVSGPDGRFSVRIQPDADQRLRANKKGLPPAKSDTLHLASGERKSGVVLTIPSGVAVTGRVTDSAGKPLSGVAVGAAEAEGGGRGLMIRRMVMSMGMSEEEDLVTTGSDGSFTMRVKEGTYDFAFRREGFAPKQVRAISVAASGENRVDTTLDPAVEITGRVTRGGVGVPDVMVMMMAESSSMIMTGPDGSFTLGGLAPGQARVMFRKENDFVNETRNLTAPARDVNIDLPPGGQVSGHVFEKGTRKPITAFQAGISTSRGGGSMVMMGPPQLQNFTSDDGSFTLEHVPAGAQTLVAAAPGFSGARTSVDVVEGKSVSDVVIELDAGVRLFGKVTGPNGEGLADVRVGIQPSMTGSFAMTGALRNATTDANGEYSIESMEPGEEKIEFSHAKYVGATRTVTLKGRETRLDVSLSGGQRVTGVVVTESGMPVADAQVEAFSAGGAPRNARTNSAGAFEFESLSPARYQFSAQKAGYLEGKQEDVDISAGTPIRLVLGAGGTIYGHVMGVADADLSGTTVTAQSGRTQASASVDPSGNYRIEGAPTGTVQVSASVMSRTFMNRRTSPTQTVEVAAGSAQQVNLEFSNDTVIRGRVLRNGAPMAGASVAFYPRGGASRAYNSVTSDDQGSYTVSGLEEGEYNVMVMDMQRFSSYSTTYNVHGSSTYDIEFKAASVRGHVADRASNEPIGEATVSFRPTSPTAGDFRGARSVMTDANGNFSVDFVSPGPYTITTSRDGYGNELTETTITESGRDDLQLTLARNDGVNLKVVDARDGRALTATVIVFDMQGRVAWDQRTMMFGMNGGDETAPVKIAVPPGSYVATVSAPGYAAQTMQFTSPSSRTAALTPGGRIMVRSKHTAAVRVRLVDSSGFAYPRYRAEPTSYELPPGTLPVENVAPGSYTLQIINPDQSVGDTVQVVVREGETVPAEI
jgi:protocatechuate 3,4-dioxygenase beta subunit